MTPRRDLELKEKWSLVAQIPQSAIVLRPRPLRHTGGGMMLSQRERDPPISRRLERHKPTHNWAFCSEGVSSSSRNLQAHHASCKLVTTILMHAISTAAF